MGDLAMRWFWFGPTIFYVFWTYRVLKKIYFPKPWGEVVAPIFLWSVLMVVVVTIIAMEASGR